MATLVRCIMGAENLPAFVEGMLNLAVGMTVWETREHGSEKQQVVSYRGVPYEIGTLTVTVDIVSDDSWVDDIVRKVREAHLSQQFSVRHIYLFPVEQSYHIRNGFMDN